MTESGNYSAGRETVDGVEVVRLTDIAARAEVSIAPSIGNMAYEMRVCGKNLLWFPYGSPAEMRGGPMNQGAGIRDRGAGEGSERASTTKPLTPSPWPPLCGVPFLAPWANRLDQDAYWANGKRYTLNPGLGNLRRDSHGKPIHGLLNFSAAWAPEQATADGRAAWVSSRLEFWKHPEMMAQFPFAHSIVMTHRLSDGVLEVETTIENLSDEPMPLAVGFHPYLRLHAAPRMRWQAHIPVRTRFELSELSIPTGARTTVELADPYPLSSGPLDDVFTDLARGSGDRTVFWVESAGERISVTFGPRFVVAVVFAPEGKDFICFEPMTAVTNAFNLAQSGQYAELQSVPPGGRWQESFWISGAGFD